MPRLRPIPEPQPAAPPKEEDPNLKLAEPYSDEPEVIVEEKPPQQNEADLALKKQIDRLRQEAELGRRLQQERDQALLLAAEQQKKASRSERDRLDGEDERLKLAINSAKMTAEKALADLNAAESAGDIEAKNSALARMVDATAEAKRFEEARESLKGIRKDFKKERKQQREKLEQFHQQQQQRPPTHEYIRSLDLPNDCKDWLDSHQEYIEDKWKANDLAYIHNRAERDGLRPGMPGYLDYINDGLRQIGSLVPTTEERRENQQRASMMSAPVSREVPSGGGGQRPSTRITLTPAQKEAAKMSGLSEADYAKNLIKMNEMKANGTFGGQQ